MAPKKTLVIASTNENKIKEISSIAGSFGYEVISRAAAGLPDIEIEESGETFEENALLKARFVFDALGGREAVAADDSGIEVDALGGAPGIYSARFASLPPDFSEASGKDLDKENNEKLLKLLSGVPHEQRTARFVSVIVCILPGKDPLICRGEAEGHIGTAGAGTAGFGYDPLFIPLGYDKSYGLLSPEEKNAISHRSKALSVLAKKLAEEVL